MKNLLSKSYLSYQCEQQTLIQYMILEVYLLARVRYWTLLVFCSVTLYWLVENWTVPCGLSFGCMDKTKFLLGPILPLLTDTKVNTISCCKKKKVFIDVTMYNSSVYCRYLFFLLCYPQLCSSAIFFFVKTQTELLD